MYRAVLFFGILALMWSPCANGQTAPDSIRIIENGLSTKFLIQRLELGPDALVRQTEEYALANRHMRRARTYDVFAKMFAYSGGFLIGWPLGTAIAGGDANWTLLGIGGGLIVLGLPFVSGYVSNAKKGAKIYNEELRIEQNNRRSIEIGIGFVPTGLGVRIGFR